MAIATSARNLMTGSGNVSTTAGSRLIAFTTAQSFKKGETVIANHATTPQYFTIDAGVGTNWVVVQAATASLNGVTFKRTQTSNTRARGASGEIIPGAVHYMYRSQQDEGGAADWYMYFDTIVPEKGRHPYTKDLWTGGSTAASDTKQAVVADLGTRVRILEGALRVHATVGDITNPDRRLDAIEARLNALDGQGVTAWTVQQLLDAGDTV